MQDLEQQVREAGREQAQLEAMVDAFIPWLTAAVVVAGLFVAVAWWRSRLAPGDADVRARTVYMLQAVWWARGPHRSPSRWLRRKLRRYERHSWPVLGKDYEAQHMAMFSGTDTGKTQRVVIPMMVRRLRECRVSLAIMDPKGELYEAAYPFLVEAAGCPPVHLLSALPEHRRRSVAVDPFATEERRRRFLRGVFATQEAKESYWLDAARDMWDVVAGALGDADLITTWAVLRNPAMLDELVERRPEVKAVWAGSEIRGSHTEIRNNAVTPFEGLKDERIRRLFDRRRCGGSAGGPTFAEREMVYICVTNDDAENYGALFAGLVAELQHRATGRRKGAPNVEFVVDEAGTCYPLQRLKGYINICRGKGVNIALFFQDYTQVISRLPKDHDSVIGACKLALIGSTANQDTQAYAERRSGTAYVARPGQSDPDHKEKRPRIRREDVEKLREGEFYVFHLGAIPSRIRQKAVWIKYKTFVVPPKEKRGKPNLVRPPRREALTAGAPPATLAPQEPRNGRQSDDQQEPRQSEGAARKQTQEPAPSPAQTAPRFALSGTVPTFSGTSPQQDGDGAPTDPPPTDPPPGSRDGPTFDRGRSLEIRNGKVLRACSYCGHTNRAAAETCQNGTCGASLA